MNLVYICVCVFVFVGVGLTEFLCHQQISVPSKACLLSAGFVFFYLSRKEMASQTCQPHHTVWSTQLVLCPVTVSPENLPRLFNYMHLTNQMTIRPNTLV